ncbi:hypothetical protein A3A46_04005 [Candidatus Roizmanbacteria bacterium RIFCSPLOWO2_01_FULL_37_13]|uniref:Glycosyltransferase 2-like domain-containing protein n=1 Tax=Candidatus Roizmanbacteria bacterium RIFCSPHIGHO2_02_FULL_38_11 TaxID=1802039 RepID=A0A1F7H1K6_9BACT|nr:MAG: hypothetical protein A3C25_03440 [Candidatus Roizmanbacteria bacterium RIFCSPHIGHO2_02_FULL_38_11]OGK40941.1 MAG: hypothetical protein A3A46_04005 [Candidatus Roizmanbacteria bacterium RIFCSPLOWO2_01_FULL_37_13]
MNTNLSVIILSYNTKELTNNCLSSLIKSLPRNKNFKSEIIVVDNGSTDGSVDLLKNYQKSTLNQNKYGSGLPRTDLRSGTGANISFKLIFNKKNLGYPKGNNRALKIATGKYILFLNSDVIVDKIEFKKLLSYLESHSDVGVLTVKVTLPDGSVDPASHRGFPTIWNSFCYFVGLEELLRSVPYLNRLFGGYHLVHLNFARTHEVDSVSGAFYLSRIDILKEIKGFDEAFFMYGEDLDLSFRIKKLGYQVVYYPDYKVTHLKHASGLEKNNIETRKKTKLHFFDAMKIFYRKHYEKNHNKLINNMIYFFIKVLKNIG